MSIHKFFKMQQKFDNKVLRVLGKAHPSIAQKATAFITEVGEFANEEGSVKYWKARNKQDLGKALFEYIDCYKFLVSIANDLGIEATQVKSIKVMMYPTVNEQLLALAYVVATAAKMPDINEQRKYILIAFQLLKGIQVQCSFTDAKVFEVWMVKHAENIDRLRKQVAA